jgi:hypothetical protein
MGELVCLCAFFDPKGRPPAATDERNLILNGPCHVITENAASTFRKVVTIPAIAKVKQLRRPNRF